MYKINKNKYILKIGSLLSSLNNLYFSLPFVADMSRVQHNMGLGTGRKRVQGDDDGVQDGDP